MKKVYSRFVSLLLALAMVIAVFPVISFAANDEMSLKVSTVSGCPGETVQVTVELSENPGIASLKFDVSFDEAYLTLTGVTFAEGFGSYVTAPEPFKSPQTISLISPLEAITTNGLFATLSFAISSEAPDGAASAITVTYDEDDVFDSEYNTIALNVTNGLVNIYEGIPGDIDGDKKVNNKDAILLFRYVAGWSVTVDFGALDVNGDGKANNKDAITLFRYVAGWPDITLVRGTVCAHSLEATAEKAATCTESGNIAYWHCLTCGRYYRDANATKEITLADTVKEALGHTPVTDPAVPPTTTTEGLTEGSHCAVCGIELVAQQSIPKLEAKEHAIHYDVGNGYTYIQELWDAGEIVNINPSVFSEEEGLTLKNLSVKGYRFLGWFDGAGDGAGSNAVQIKTIAAGTTEDVELYAHWERIEYKITFDNSSMNQPSTTKVYYVDDKFPLDRPSIDRYVFLGWTTDSDELVSEIKTGTIGSFTLHSNWTSKRNLARPVSSLGEPMIVEDTVEGKILFTYEIGQIENVPLYTIKNLPSAGGVVSVYTETTTKAISTTDAATIAKAIDHVTTDSTAWTLSEDWNETTHVEDSVLEEHGYDRTTGQEVAKTSSNTYTLSTSEYDNTLVKTNDGTVATTTQYNTNEVKERATWESKASLKVSDTESAKYTTSSEMSSEVGVNLSPISAKMKASQKSSSEIKSESSIGASAETTVAHEATSNTKTGTDTVTVKDNTTTTTTDKGWSKSSNSSSSSSSSFTSYEEQTLSENIAKQYTYGQSYAKGGANSQSADWSTSTGESEQYSSTLTYFNSEETTEAVSYEINGETDGSYRLVRAGVVHVFGVVIYDIATAQYSVSTYSVLDDETYTYIDYSATSAAKFDDNENGVLPFEIPYFVNDYVNGRVIATDGLKYNAATLSTGAYEGSNTSVIIPEFISVDNQDGTHSAYTIRNLSAETFQGKEELKSVMLSGFINEIPDAAFAGCTSLQLVYGSEIRSIGNNAFDGCTSLGAFKVSSTVRSIGENAFRGVDSITVTASGLDVVLGAINSGAKNITINISAIADQMEGVTLVIPDTVETFELQGGRNTFNGLRIKSDAAETILNGITIRESTGIPLEISSEAVTLNQVIVESPSYVLLLSGNAPTVSLYGLSGFLSSSANAMVCRNVTFNEIGSNLTAKLEVTGNLLYYGTLNNTSFVSFPERGELVALSADEFEKYIKGSLQITFDANGGAVETSSMIAYIGAEIGTLPVPTRDHYTFDGWYLQDGTEITASSVFNSGGDVTLYAHWTPIPYTVSWETGTGYAIAVSRTSSPYAGAGIGDLSSGATVYYGDELSIAYTPETGYSLGDHGETTVTVAGNVNGETIYAEATPNDYTYSIVYKSSNGTSLGTSSVTHTFGTTNTISAPAKSGYVTPAAQSITWDATSKTITFIYTPSSVTNSAITGNFLSSSPKITYSTKMNYRNRTATSVEVQITTTVTMQSGWNGYGYGVALRTISGSTDSGQVQIASYNGLSSAGSSRTASTGWMKVSLGTTNATSVSFSGNLYNTNWEDKYVNSSEYADVYYTWTMKIPAY